LHRKKELIIAKPSARRRIRRSPKLLNSDGNGNRIYNQILLCLPQNEREVVFPKLELVRLKLHQVLHEVGDTLKSGYFCNTGMISILNVFPDGKIVGVGIVGKEGFAGLPLVAGFGSAATRAVVQMDATAWRVGVGASDVAERRIAQAIAAAA